LALGGAVIAAREGRLAGRRIGLTVLAIAAALALVWSLDRPSTKRARVAAQIVDPAEFAADTMGTRLALDRATGRMARAHPWLGIGRGRFESDYPAYRRPGEPLELLPMPSTHCDPLQYAAEAGVPAAAFAAAFLGILGWTAWRRARSSPSPSLRSRSPASPVSRWDGRDQSPRAPARRGACVNP